jgi:ornithine cyclodeaminase/alanine dehydrogenase-like protein (mu-crystallin family)
MALLLQSSEVEPLLTLPDAIEVVDRLFRDQAGGQIASHPPATARVAGGSVRVNLGVLGPHRLLGARVNGSGGGRSTSLGCLFDAETGEVVSVLGYPFSQLRLAAVSAVSARYLAPAGELHVGLLGTGTVAWHALRGVCATLDPVRVSVFGRDRGRREAFASRVREELDVACTPAETAGRVVEGASVLLCATSSREPVFGAAQLADGTHVGAFGAPAELPGDLTDRAGAVFSGAGEPPRHRVADAISGSWSRGGDDVTAFVESQGICADLALSAAAYERAVEAGLGRKVDLD